MESKPLPQSLPPPPPPPPPSSSSSSSSRVSRTVVAFLVLRVLTVKFLLAALIIIGKNNQIELTSSLLQYYYISFNNVYSFRYMVGTIVIGLAYSVFQMILSILNVTYRTRPITGDVGYQLDFFGDKIVSLILGTGAAAGYGASIDMSWVFLQFAPISFQQFFTKARASATLLLFAFLLTALASVFTSFALPKKLQGNNEGETLPSAPPVVLKVEVQASDVIQNVVDSVSVLSDSNK